MTRFRLWWDAADAALAARGEPPLDYEDARSLFDCELEPDDVPDAIVLAPVAKAFEGKPMSDPDLPMADSAAEDRNATPWLPPGRPIPTSP